MLKSVIPKLGKEVTKLGFGSYRVSQANHGKALISALQGGINIIDTGNNFEQGRSETCIGDTLTQLDIPRESLTLVSKSGYLNANEIHSYDSSEYVQINDKSYHSIHPRVIEHQLMTSLERLKTDKLDIYMINSPERMLMGKNRTYSHRQLYHDMKESFTFLDGLVANGILGGYGVCSNTLALPDAADHVSLNEIIQSCDKLNNLVAIQVPFNLYEHEAILGENQQKTVATLAKEHDIYLMTNRPLNAIAHGQIRVLVNHSIGTEAEQKMISDMSSCFDRIAQMETEMTSELPEEELTAQFVWSQVLSENLSRLSQNHFATRHYLTNQVMPAIEKDLAELSDYAHKTGDKLNAYEEWMSSYRESIHELTGYIVNYAYMDTLRKNNELDRVLTALCPALKETKEAHSPLTVKLLRFLMSHEEVGTVFTGMRDPVYVKDALIAAHQPPLDDLDAVWQCPVF